MGHAVDQDLLSLFQQLVVDLMKTYRLTVRKSLAGKKRELSEIQQAVASLQNQQKSLESRAVNEGQDEVTQLQKEDLTRILERLESLEKSLGGEIRNKIRRLEQESVRGNQKLQELEKRRVETDGKVQQLENDIYLKTIAGIFLFSKSQFSSRNEPFRKDSAKMCEGYVKATNMRTKPAVVE